MQLLIYCPKVTPRIKYIFNFVFREILICDFEFTSIASDFGASELPKISYAEAPLADELFFCADPLLTAHRVAAVTHKLTTFGEVKVPFAVENGVLPFDIFAASFYFISRYEEYLPFEGDDHQRFPAAESLQHQLDLLKTPIIDHWAIILKNILAKQFPSLTFGKRKFRFLPTIDVNRAYHFRSNGLLKNSFRIVKAAVNLNTEKILNIISTGLGKVDPFDTFNYLAYAHEQYRLKPIYFFLMAKKGHPIFDQNIDPEDESFQALIREVTKDTQIGIHPSYASHPSNNMLTEELSRLETIANKKTDLSRQHFLRVNLPQTYLQLIKAGINHDYSMGYANEIGFKAGTCTPFFWYDLQLEKQSHLKIHPFAVMDETLQHFLKLNPAQAIELIESIITQVKLVNGTFCSLWHNESVSETGKWKGWRKVYEEMLKGSLN